MGMTDSSRHEHVASEIDRFLADGLMILVQRKR